MGIKLLQISVSDITTKELRNAIHVQIIDEMNDLCLQFLTTNYGLKSWDSLYERNAAVATSQLDSVPLGSQNFRLELAQK